MPPRSEAELARLIGECDQELLRLHRFDTLTGAQEERERELLSRRHSLWSEDGMRRAVEGRLEYTVEAGSDTYGRDALTDARDVGPRKFTGDPWQGVAARMAGPGGFTGGISGGEARSRALTAAEKAPAASDATRERMTALLADCDDADGTLARQMLATSSPDYLAGWARYMRGDTDLTSDAERAALRAGREAARAMSLTDSAGGLLVPFQLDPTVLIQNAGAANPIAALARNVVAVGDIWHGVASAGVVASFDAEAAEVSDDTPELTQPAVTVRTARAFVPYSLEVGQDAPNLAAELARLFADARDNLEAAVMVSGTAAANQPVGIVTALTGTDAEVEADDPGSLTAADLTGAYSAVGPRYRQRASWVADAPALLDAGKLLLMSGQTLADVPGSLLARPTAVASEVPAGTVIFGDWSQYVVARRIGLQVEVVPHLFGGSGRPTGQRGAFAWWRTGADCVNPAAFVMLTGTAT